MFYSGGRAKKQNVNKIIGKKQTQPINDIKIDNRELDKKSTENNNKPELIKTIETIPSSNTGSI